MGTIIIKPIKEILKICGRCDKRGVIWFTQDEANLYEEGKRIFDRPNYFVRMMADDSGLNTSRIL
jgi:hypothetical protein